MNRYNPSEIEPKWQAAWAESRLYEVSEDVTKEKRYIAGMFPYPSGAGLHVGHVRNYSIVDVIARFHRQRGYNVLNPLGWDTFGLPAENYAIKTGTPPAVSTAQNIKNFKNQIQRLGMSIDWSRELNTTDPEYYRWTQWIFTKLFERGLAYQAEREQWWCPHDKTVLANEQVEAGRCWRCGHEVVKKLMKQWFFKITEYADELLAEVDALDWPEGIKAQQKNWIGKSIGAEVDFAVMNASEKLRVFTTRVDTLYGATFLVVAPEHPLLAQLTSVEQNDAVNEYVRNAQKKSEIERQDAGRDKTGVFTGSYVTNPLTHEQIPVWVADYVLMGYGTGAIMAVPAHDERDNDFAKKFDLPIKTVVAQDFGKPLENTAEVTGSVAIVYDQQTHRWLGLKTDSGVLLPGGGRENNETFEQTAVRELSEETGFQAYEKVVALGDPHYSYYFNPVKKVNKRSFGQGFVFFVNSLEQAETQRESYETYESTWYEYDELIKGIQKLGNNIEHYLALMERAKSVVEGTYQKECFHGDGILVNSGSFSGIPTAEARELIVQHLAREGSGQESTQYRMRDWLISRQRYWGAPIPMIHCEKDGAVPVPEDQLPVILPEVKNYEPDGSGVGVLGRVDEWVNTACPTCGGPAKRETDTMDGYACSSWYFLRYADPKNDHAAWDSDKANYWMPIDYYCGGDHAVSHLLYSRFWTKVFADMGLVSGREPVKKLVYNGYINAADGQKMSKSKGNVVDPLELVDAGYGADALRVYELFIGPYDLDAAWDPNGIVGSHRFLNRIWNLVQEYNEATNEAKAPLVAVHQTIKKVSEDLERLSFNTAIAAQMELVNELYKSKSDGMKDESWHFALTSLVQLVAPFAPHIADELWQQLGRKGSVHTDGWPVWDDALLVRDTVKIVVQVNGKVRVEIEIDANSDQNAVEKAALSHERVQGFIADKEPSRIIYVPRRLLNIVIR